MDKIIKILENVGENIKPNDIREIENKTVRLVEERGVAAFPYKNIAKQIFDYIEKKCLENKNHFLMRFIIPEEITEKIDFINNLEIYVKITNYPNNIFYTSGSRESYFNLGSDKIINGKLNGGKIVIYCTCHKGRFDKNTLYNNFYHELNHYYEAYKDLLKNGSYIRFNKQIEKSKIGSEFSYLSDTNKNSFFSLIFYRLFTETELNALVSSVYGDLEGIASKRNNFRKDINKTQAYIIYNQISNNYKSIIKNLSDYELGVLKDFLTRNKFILNDETFSLEELRRFLLHKINFLLKQLIRGIGKVASLYYMKKNITNKRKTCQ